MVTRSAPGPRGRDLLRVYGLLGRDPLAAFSELASEYGPAVQFPLTPRHPVYLLTRPEHAEHVLAAHQGNYIKAFTYRPLREVLGSGLLTSEGAQWRRHRRLLQPLFASRHVTGFAPVMAEAAERTVTRWDALPDGSVLDLTTALGDLTLGVVGRTLFGADLAGTATRVGAAVTALQRVVVGASKSPIAWMAPRLLRWRLTADPRYEPAASVLDGTVRDIIARRRSAATAGPEETPAEGGFSDLLGALLAARDEDGSGLSDAEISDEVMTFFLAGHETTANALGWTLTLLSAHPGTRKRLEAEVDGIIGDRPPGIDDVDKLVWTRAALQESMRIYPPAWTIERDALVDDEVAGTAVPAGSTVIVPPYLIHRNPDVWDNPEGFDPERFLPESGGSRHRYAYLPFGGGRRGCIGGGFAQLEATLALASVIRRYRLDLVPGGWPERETGITLRPRHNLTMTVHRR